MNFRLLFAGNVNYGEVEKLPAFCCKFTAASRKQIFHWIVVNLRIFFTVEVVARAWERRGRQHRTTRQWSGRAHLAGARRSSLAQAWFCHMSCYSFMPCYSVAAAWAVFRCVTRAAVAAGWRREGLGPRGLRAAPRSPPRPPLRPRGPPQRWPGCCSGACARAWRCPPSARPLTTTMKVSNRIVTLLHCYLLLVHATIPTKIIF